MRFPDVDGLSLSGQPYTLPNDLGGRYTLLLIAYQPYQQRDVTSWMAPVQLLCDQFPGLHYYEIAAMWPFPASRRESIHNGMRMGLPDPADRARTITVHTDLDAFNQALALPHTETIYALLLDRQGRVIWRSEGRYTGGKGAALKAQVSET